MTENAQQAAIARRAWIAAAVIAVIALAVLAIRSREHPHSLHSSFASATDLEVGDDVDVAGIPVGRVTAISYENGRANVTLGIDDGPGWPLRRGAAAALRFGTTIGVATRRVDISQGPAGAPPIPNGGVIPATDTSTPVEWDQVFGIFDRRTRGAEQIAAQRGAEVLTGRAGDLNRGLAAVPAGTGAISGVFSDLASDQALLSRLVPETDRMTSILASQAPRISALVLVAQQTFGTFATRTQDIRAALSDLPSALQQTQATLARLDRTAGRLQPVLATLAPGARDLRSLGSYLQPALTAFESVTPAGVRAADAARVSAAPIAMLLPTLGSFLGSNTAPVLSRLAPMLDCVVPYAPELTGFLSNWDSWNDHELGTATYGRYHIIEGSSLTPSPPLVARVPGIRYARALAPGEAGGAPWELSQCGYTSVLRNPSTDPANGG